MKNTWLLFLMVCLQFNPIIAQEPEVYRLTLDEVVQLAQSDAPDVQLAKTRLSNFYWQFQSFKADYKPIIGFNATLPNLNRSIQPITLPSGTVSFIQQSFMQNNVGLALQQDIGLTGGTVILNSSLNRLDIFPNPLVPRSISYLSNPVSLSFIQPLFGFNALKWNKIIEPLRYQEAKRTYSEDMEVAAFNAVQLFFDILIAQLNVEAALQEKSNADTLYGISTGRFDVGRIAETELLQIELSVANAENSIAQSTLNLQSSIEQLRTFLGIQKAVRFEMVPPTELPDFYVDPNKALQAALQNRSVIVALERRLREAERNVAQANRQTGPQVNVNAAFGLQQTGNTFPGAFQNLLDREQISIGLDIPIVDFGKAKARREIAQSNLELERLNVSQERVNFEQNILLKVKQFDLVRSQVQRALRAYEVSRKRQEMTRNRYYIGKIGITDLNIAVQEQEAARRTYITSLRNFWEAYYDLRRSTLYDFANDRSLVNLPEGY
ncbi:MAG: TolC family protein [Saprospiraceae bacterium]